MAPRLACIIAIQLHISVILVPLSVLRVPLQAGQKGKEEEAKEEGAIRDLRRGPALGGREARGTGILARGKCPWAATLGGEGSARHGHPRPRQVSLGRHPGGEGGARHGHPS